MVVADICLAVKSSSRILCKKRSSEESNEEFVGRLTHLYMHEKKIDSIKNLSFCSRLTVLYLYDNCISKIENLNGLENLRELFLHGNNIQQIENLDCLPKLTKLYLGQNCIGVVERLDNLRLQELSMERQKLAPGEKLLFDQRSLNALAPTLEILNISYNGVDSLEELSVLYCLKTLIANHNKVIELNNVTENLRNLSSLTNLQLVGNLVTKHPHYRKNIIMSTTTLEVLDDKDILPSSRTFLQRLDQHKRSRSQTSFAKSVQTPDNSISQFGFSPPDHGFSFSQMETFNKSRDNFVSEEQFMHRMIPRPFWRHYMKSKSSVSETKSLPNLETKLCQPSLSFPSENTDNFL